MSDSAFDLDRFAPAPVTFKLAKHGDHLFQVDGDPDVDTMTRMFRIEQKIEGSAGSEMEMGEAALEGRDLLLEMIRENDPDFEGPLRMSLGDVAIVFSLILRGSTVAEAVAQAIMSPTPDSGRAESMKPFEHDGEGEPDAPLVSGRLSSEQSSSSDESEAGRLAIGTA